MLIKWYWFFVNRVSDKVKLKKCKHVCASEWKACPGCSSLLKDRQRPERSDIVWTRRTAHKRMRYSSEGRLFQSYPCVSILHQGPSTSPSHLWSVFQSHRGAPCLSLGRRSCSEQKGSSPTPQLFKHGTLFCHNLGGRCMWGRHTQASSWCVCQKVKNCSRRAAHLPLRPTVFNYCLSWYRIHKFQSSLCGLSDSFTGLKLCVAPLRWGFWWLGLWTMQGRKRNWVLTSERPFWAAWSPILSFSFHHLRHLHHRQQLHLCSFNRRSLQICLTFYLRKSWWDVWTS